MYWRSQNIVCCPQRLILHQTIPDGLRDWGNASLSKKNYSFSDTEMFGQLGPDSLRTLDFHKTTEKTTERSLRYLYSFGGFSVLGLSCVRNVLIIILQDSHMGSL